MSVEKGTVNAIVVETTVIFPALEATCSKCHIIGHYADRMQNEVIEIQGSRSRIFTKERQRRWHRSLKICKEGKGPWPSAER